MKFRKLRIAWSVSFGIACVLLIALWVRSYRWNDFFMYRMSTQTLQIQSIRGRLRYIVSGHSPSDSDDAERKFVTTSQWMGGQDADFWNSWEAKYSTRWGRDPAIQRSNFRVYAIPTWFATLLSVALALAVIPISTWRFSLRTLLIATTLVAVVLGLVVYAASK